MLAAIPRSRKRQLDDRMAAAADPGECRVTNRALLRDFGLTAISIISALRAG
jgi:hypothetical protein